MELRAFVAQPLASLWLRPFSEAYLEFLQIVTYPVGHLPGMAEINTFLRASALQEASEDTTEQGLAFANLKSLKLLKKRKKTCLPSMCLSTPCHGPTAMVLRP